MTNLQTGLTEEQVAQRHKDGRINGDNSFPTKSIPQIIRTNTITFFNILNLSLALCIFLVGSFKNALFMGVVICNTCIGIIQEIRAKRTIDRLSLISAPKACVLRNGTEQEIKTSEIVMDDIMVLRTGMQICSDCVLAEGECEVDESLITGESDPILKKVGDELLSGSLLVAGYAKAQVIRVGTDNFTSKITKDAKYIKKNNSGMINAVNTIIKGISVVILPIMTIMFLKSIFFTQEHQTFERAVVSSVAAIIGMIPEGLMLLTSIVLAVSVIRLSRHNTLVQDLYCVETLARVTTLCLDKTGTITTGTMSVDSVLPFNTATEEEIQNALSALTKSLDERNPTFRALKEAYSAPNDWTCIKSVCFSSARKYSGCTFDTKGSYIIGAPEFVLTPLPAEIKEKTEQAAKEGHRVLLLAHSENAFEGEALPDGCSPVALILLSDQIRREAPSTLAYFSRQGVELKIISGDNPITVSQVAKKAGFLDWESYVDASTLDNVGAVCDRYRIFGRVTPQQKLELIQALRSKGHVVGMTGDGANDVLALKEADVSVAMQSGSDAARAVSNLVLLDSNFASMPKVVAEGRRSINNVERSAALFLTKTVYSFLFTVIYLFIMMPYPFSPIQMTLVNSMAVGLPSFLLALEPNSNLVKGSFIRNVMHHALPYGISVVLALVGMTVASHFFSLSDIQLGTAATAVLAICSFLILFKISFPLERKKVAMIMVLAAAFFSVMVLSLNVDFFGELFIISPFTLSMGLIVLLCGVLGGVLIWQLPKLTSPLIESFFKRYEKRKIRKLKKDVI